MLDSNQIYERECTAGLKEIAPGSVDLAFADPPFNIGYEYDVYDDSREAAHYLEWSRKWIEGVFHALKPTGTFWLAIGDEYAAELKLIAQEIGFRCRSWVIWYYTFGVNCKRKFNRSHAHLFHFVKDAKRFKFNANDKMIRVPSARQLVYADGRANPDGRLPDDTWILRPQDVPNGFKAVDDTWYFPRVAGTFKERAGFHGCQMPEQLLGRIIRCCSDAGDLVLDPFSGSATTLVVAKKLGRQWIGFDLSADYVRRGKARIEAAQVNAPLEGAAEPLVSAPATPQTDIRVKDPIHLDKSRSRDSVSLARQQRAATLPRPHRSNPVGTDSAGFERGILEAFKRACNGFSVDRVVADDDLNVLFANRCTHIGLAGTLTDWNRALFRFRKAGKLSQFVTRRRTDFDWHGSDRYIFASEIAFHLIDERGYSLDDVLCDPNLRQEFDDIAKSFAPGFKPFEYRWGALKIRKVARETRTKSTELDDQRLPRQKDLLDLSLQEFRNSAGLYLINREKPVGGVRSALYAGVTFDLEQRLRMVCDGSQILPIWLEHAHSDRLTVRILPLGAGDRDTWISQFPRQSNLMKKFSPTLNITRLVGV